MQLPDMEKIKFLPHATSVNKYIKKTEDIKTFVISNIVSIVSSLSKKIDQNEVHAIKYLLQCSRSSAYRKKGFCKTWTFDRSSRQYRGEMGYQTMHCLNKKS